jgi:hypothetical protein
MAAESEKKVRLSQGKKFPNGSGSMELIIRKKIYT